MINLKVSEVLIYTSYFSLWVIFHSFSTPSQTHRLPHYASILNHSNAVFMIKGLINSLNRRMRVHELQKHPDFTLSLYDQNIYIQLLKTRDWAYRIWRTYRRPEFLTISVQLKKRNALTWVSFLVILAIFSRYST
jgi:hypothetical protein